MGASHTVEAHGGGTGLSATVVTGSQTWTTGRQVVAMMFWDDGGAATITGMSQSGGSITWTSNKIAKTSDGRHGQAMQCALGTVGTGFTGTITATFSRADVTFRAITVSEYQDGHATQFDATGTDVADAGTAVDLPLTTTQSDCLCYASSYDDNGSNTYTSNPSNMTTVANFAAGQNVCMNYRTTNPGTGATTVDFTLSGTDDCLSLGAAVAPAAAAGGGSVHRCLMMGCGI